MHLESPFQEEIDRLDASIRDLRRLVVMNGGHNPAPASHAGEAAVLLGQDEQAEALRRVERAVAGLPEAIAQALADRFDIVEEEVEEEAEPKGKGNAKAKAKAKTENNEDDEEAKAPTRRAYFRDAD